MTRNTDAISIVLFLVWFSCLLGTMHFTTFVGAAKTNKRRADGSQEEEKQSNKRQRTIVSLRNDQRNGGKILQDADDAQVLLNSFVDPGLNYVKQGFASEAAWEVFFHVAIKDNLGDMFQTDIIREKKLRREEDQKSVDFFFEKKKKKYCVAIEVKVEIKKEKGKKRSYGGKGTIQEAMLKDITKLKKITKEELGCGQRYLAKWSTLIVESTEHNMKQLGDFLVTEKYCYQLINHETFAFVLIFVGHECLPNELYLTGHSNSFEAQVTDLIVLKELDTENIEINFLNGILDTKYAEYFQKAYRQGEQWEVYAQVLISTKIQNQLGYKVGIREFWFPVEGYDNLKDRYADFLFTATKFDYVIELKVSLLDENMESLADRFEWDVNKLLNYRGPKQMKWVLAIAETTSMKTSGEKHCDNFLKRLVPESSCSESDINNFSQGLIKDCPTESTNPKSPRTAKRKCQLYLKLNSGILMALLKIMPL